MTAAKRKRKAAKNKPIRYLKWAVIVLGGLLLLGLLLEGLRFYLVLNPRHLFEHRLEHGSFVVLSNDPIDPALKPLLDRVQMRLGRSAFSDPSQKWNLVVAGDGLYSRIDGHDEEGFSVGDSVVLNGILDCRQNRIRSRVKELNLVHLITHEAVHCQQQDVYGLFFNSPVNPNRRPQWKVEGYAEYIAQESLRRRHDYSLSGGIKQLLAFTLHEPLGNRWVNLGNGIYTPARYFKYRLMTEYLVDARGMEPDAVMKASLDESKVYREMLDWQTLQGK